MKKPAGRLARRPAGICFSMKYYSDISNLGLASFTARSPPEFPHLKAELTAPNDRRVLPVSAKIATAAI